MKLLLINDILRHTYGLIEIRSIKGADTKSYSFKTKYSDTQYTGTFFEQCYKSNVKSEDVVDDAEDVIEPAETDASENCFAIEFNNTPTEKEIGLLKRIREKFAEQECFVSLYNTKDDEPFEI